MKTPIYDFVSSYIAKDPVRFHMPGHKGRPLLGCEERDLTEISGADVLSEADGVILESENNASLLFGTAHSFYCTEGSSQCIRAMLAMVATAKEHRTRPRRILAARNAHKAMIQASALLGLEVDWLYPEEETHLCSCPITAAQLRDALEAAPMRRYCRTRRGLPRTRYAFACG